MSPVKSQSRTNVVGQKPKLKTAKNGSQQKNTRQIGSKVSQPPSKLPRKERGKSTSSDMKYNNKNKVNGRSQFQREKEITDCKTTKGEAPPRAVTTKPWRVNIKLPTKLENKRSDKVTDSAEEEEEESESDAGSLAEVSEEETSDDEKEEDRGSNEDPAETQESEQISEAEAEALDTQSDTKQTTDEEADEELLGEFKSRSDSEVEPVASSTEEEENEKEAEVSEVAVCDGNEDRELSVKITATKVWRRRSTPRPSKLAKGLKYKMFKKTKAEKEEKKRAVIEKQRLEKGLKEKAKEEKKNKKKPQKENKPSSAKEETPPLKGHTLNKDNAVKGKTQKADTAKTKISHMKDAPVESNPNTVGEEEVEPTLSKAMKGQNQIMLLKARGKDLKAIMEPGVQQDCESVAKQSLLLGKVKMASLRDKASKIKLAKSDVDTSVSEVTDASSSKPKEHLIAQRKGMTTLRQVSGWIQQNIPKGLNVRKKLSAWTKAIGLSHWLSLRAIKQKQGTRKFKGMMLKHRMTMRAVSKTSLAHGKHRSSSEDKMTKKEKTAPEEKAEEGNREPAPVEEKEIEAKYAVVLPRMNKLRMDRPTKTPEIPHVAPETSTPLSTAGSPGEPSTSELKPPKPGARLLLPVKPDLNFLKSIKKPLPRGLPSAVTKMNPESISREGPSNTEDNDRSTAYDYKNGVNMLQAARRKLNPTQIYLTKMTLSQGTIGGGPTRAKGSDPVREDAEGMSRSTTQPFSNGETNAVMSVVRSLYEEEADREVAQLMGDSDIYTVTQPEVHWAGNPRMSGDPQVCVPSLVADSSRRITSLLMPVICFCVCG